MPAADAGNARQHSIMMQAKHVLCSKTVSRP
jgi:hypothetical protein